MVLCFLLEIAMTAPADDRINALRNKAHDGYVYDGVFHLNPTFTKQDWSDLLSLLDAHAALKAQVERLNEMVEADDVHLKLVAARVEKAEADLRDQVIADGYSVAALKAEVERLRAMAPIANVQLGGDAEYWKARAEKAEAELEAARPLIEAVMGDRYELYGYEDRVLLAALALRQRKEKGNA
jgi:hypothetical protein